MFLTDMKFISKFLYILLMENVSFPDPHLHETIFEICTHVFSKKQNTKQKLYSGHTFFKNVQTNKSNIDINNIFQDASILFLVLFEVF